MNLQHPSSVKIIKTLTETANQHLDYYPKCGFSSKKKKIVYSQRIKGIRYYTFISLWYFGMYQCGASTKRYLDKPSNNHYQMYTISQNLPEFAKILCKF